MSNFVYVFDEDAKKKMLELQFELLKADSKNHIYVFVNDGHKNFAMDDISCIMSDVLTF